MTRKPRRGRMAGSRPLHVRSTSAELATHTIPGRPPRISARPRRQEAPTRLHLHKILLVSRPTSRPDDEGPSGTRTCPPCHLPRGFAAPSPARLATDCPPRPPRGFAARVAGAEHTPVCEHRSAATAQSAGRIVGRRQIEELTANYLSLPWFLCAMTSSTRPYSLASAGLMK